MRIIENRPFNWWQTVMQKQNDHPKTSHVVPAKAGTQSNHRLIGCWIGLGPSLRWDDGNTAYPDPPSRRKPLPCFSIPPCNLRVNNLLRANGRRFREVPFGVHPENGECVRSAQPPGRPLPGGRTTVVRVPNVVVAGVVVVTTRPEPAAMPSQSQRPCAIASSIVARFCWVAR